MDIIERLGPLDELCNAGHLSEALQSCGALWMEIPDPKVEVPNAYLVIEYGVSLALELGDLEDAQKWAELAPAFAAKRHDVGEVEFLIGKVAFARGEFEAAKENFLVANKKSKGRMFQGEDKKYRDLIR